MSVIVTNTEKQTDLIDAENDGSLADLHECEAIIEQSLRNSFYTVGQCLRKINNMPGKPYEREYGTFKNYVKQRWGWEESRAYQYMDAADAMDSLKNSTIVEFLPSRESHVRELLKLESTEDRAKVWDQVVEQTDGKPIAKDVEAAVKKFESAKSKNWVTVEEWESMSAADRDDAMAAHSSTIKFNPQDTDSIEWARWSWNPVTGCEHNCPYCYARDLANRFYPQGFRPSIVPERLSAPGNTSVPSKADDDISYKNIFTCSMADLFGRWVPREWIDAVMGTVEAHEEWNFLFLTKFPQRFAELDSLPHNAWMGTTVDCQDRVANAEKAFEKVKHGTKWLSVEPMLTPLTFKRLDLFDWVVIGGASDSSQTPEWSPPFDWVVDLHNQAREANCAVYHKSNLFPGISSDIRLREFPWSVPEFRKLPEQLQYLNIASKNDSDA